MNEKYERKCDKMIEWVHADVKEIRQDVKTLTKEVSALKVKSGVWGAIAGIIPASLAILWFWIKGRI